MFNFLEYIFAPASINTIQIVWFLLRVSIGILTIFHGIPKMSGIETWHNLGVTFMYPLGIRFFPVIWGFLGAITEFFGGIFLTIGLGTRIASFALIIMMVIATSWHIVKGDSFMKYSFPLTLIFVYSAFFLVGGGIIAFDNYIARKI